MRMVRSVIFLFFFFLLSPLLTRAQYCIPTYVNICADNPYNLSFIHDFTLNTLINTGSGCNGNANNYINYSTAQYTTQLEAGGEYELMVACGFGANVRVYFDFNKDFDFRDAGEFFDIGEVDNTPTYYKITIPAWVSGNIRLRVRSGDNTTTSTHDCNNMYWGETEDYTISVVPPFNMSHVKTNIIQDETYAIRGDSDQKIIGVEVETVGSLSPLTLTDLFFTTNGTTDVSDITNAKVYYTGTDRNFSTDVSFSSVVVSPDGSFLFAGTQVLEQGKNFFWLTYDISPTAILDNYADASCVSLKIDGVDYVPLNPSPSGSREIFAFTIIKNGAETVGDKYFFDDGGYDSTYSHTNYIFTVYPEQIGSFVQVDFIEFDLCQFEVGCDYMKIYNGNSVSAPLIGEFYSDSPGTIVSTAADGSLTFEFYIGEIPKFIEELGWKARVTNVSNLPAAFISGYRKIKAGESTSLPIALTGIPPWKVIYTNGVVDDTIYSISTAVYSLITSQPGNYAVLKVFDGLNREGSFSGSAVVELDTTPDKLTAPEGISPNGDSYNEYFVIEGVKDEVSLYVYNREGGLVYVDGKYRNDWNGKNKSGENLPDGTYYYVIVTKDRSQTLKSYVEIRR